MIKNIKNKKGITLVALVATIIVLLILAGTTITMLVGDNGIISQAKKTQNLIERDEDNTQKGLQDLIDELNKYYSDNPGEETVDFATILRDLEAKPNDYLAQAQALGQTTATDIGIGTDGKVVNLDLWHYQKTGDGMGMDLGIYAECDFYEAGYKNANIINGEIKGTVPQYIYIASENKTYAVTAMNNTFNSCTALTTAPTIPASVTDMSYTFSGCTGLTTASTIPLSVTNMNYTFYGCTKLKGNLVINANPTSYNYCLHNAGKDASSKLYLSGSSPMLVALLNTKGESTNIETEFTEKIKANLNTYLEQAKALGQTTDTNIGIGTDEKAVNLDLWHYEKMEDGCSVNLGGKTESNDLWGYHPENITSEGKIQGKVPQYIYYSDEKTLYAVTGMNNTFNYFFHDNSETAYTLLKYAPEIPKTVVKMAYTFNSCRNLTTAPIIPSGVTSMYNTFYGCTSLTTAPKIPSSVTNMNLTFSGCTSLTTAPIIPSSVTDMYDTFSGCTKLQGDLVINANPTYYDSCLYNAGKDASSKLYLSGSSTKLNDLLNTKGSSTNIEIKQ